MVSPTKWVYISRNVEPTVEKWLLTPCSVILVRGNRRVGKSTTVKAVLDRLQLKYLQIFIYQDDQTNNTNIKDKFSLGRDILVSEVGRVIVNQVCLGKIIILEEIQNASTSFQISLQEGIDHMAQGMMFFPEEWKNAGVLVLMGSLPGLVDIMVESRKNPLYQRITTKITIQPFDTQELCKVFKLFQLNDFAQLLSFKTILGSMPFRYEIAFRANLLRSAEPVDNILKEFVASELQQESLDAKSYYNLSFGSQVASALRAINKYKTKNDQIIQISSLLNLDKDSVFHFLYNDLHHRYGLIAPEYKISSPEIVRFGIIDSTLRLTHYLDEGIERPDQRRTIDQADLFKLKELEGKIFERWVREIIEDRYMLSKDLPILPHHDFEFSPRCRPLIEVGTIWDIKGCEIDFIASIPTKKILLIGSCKREVSKLDYKNLQHHWETAKRNKINGICSRLKVENISSWEEKFVLFTALGTDMEIHQKKGFLPQTCYLFSLKDLLSGFL